MRAKLGKTPVNAVVVVIYALVWSLALSGCMTQELPKPASAAEPRSWTAIPCDPTPQDWLPINAHAVLGLMGNISEVVQNVAAALGQSPAIRNETSPVPPNGDDGWGGNNSSGSITPSVVVGLSQPHGHRWETPQGVLAFDPWWPSVVTVVLPDREAAQNLADAGHENTDGTGTWTYTGSVGSLPDPASIDSLVLTTYAALGADPGSIHFWPWWSNETSHEPYSPEVTIYIRQETGNLTLSPTWWTWEIEPTGNITIQQSIGPVFDFEHHDWLPKEDLQRRMRDYTECLIDKDGLAIDPAALGYDIQDAFVIDGTLAVVAVAAWTEPPCDTYPVFSTYIDAQTGVILEPPGYIEEVCPFLDGQWDEYVDEETGA